MSHRLETWFADLVLAVEWIAVHEWEAKVRKDISHVGGHFSDWVTTAVGHGRQEDQIPGCKERHLQHAL